MILIEDTAPRICPACQSRQFRPFGNRSGYEFTACRRCGTVFTTVDGASEQVRELYDHYYDAARFELSPAAAASLDRLVRSCEQHWLTGRWLDIGYGEGGLLSRVEEHGWQCYGLELSPRALDFGAERGWTVTADAESDERFPADGFDVVTMIEFIEHTTKPDLSLALAARLLRPGGLLYLTTPNATSINRRMLGAEWSVFSPPEHVTIWSARGIKTALERAGLRVLRVRTEGFNPGELLNRRRRSQGLPAPSRNETAFALNQAMSSSQTRRALKRAVNSVLSACRAGDSLKVRAVKGSLGA